MCCRDVDQVKAGKVVNNVICCGHCQNTSIQRMAFSPNDSILVGYRAKIPGIPKSAFSRHDHHTDKYFFQATSEASHLDRGLVQHTAGCRKCHSESARVYLIFSISDL